MEANIEPLGAHPLQGDPQEEARAESPTTAVAALVDAHFRCCYLDDAPEELTCPICTEPALEALELCDEHLICAACVPVIAQRSTCPVCHVQLPTDEEGARVLAPPGRRIVRMLEKLSVACPLQPCPWVGPRGNLRDHLRISCGHIPCTLAENGCVFKGTATAVLRHVVGGCEDVQVQESPIHMKEAQEPKPQPPRERPRAEVEPEVEEERLLAREALVQAALVALVDTDVVTLLVQDRRFSVSRHLLLHAQCRGSVLEALGKNDRAEFRIDCGEREFLVVLSWVRYGLVPMQAGMTESEWAELLALARALCLDGMERALRSPSRSAVTALAAVKGATVNLPGYDLSGISLTCALTHADLSGSNLSGSQLACNLSLATLHGCDLSDANLSGSVLSQTDFASSNLQRITLTGEVHYVSFRGCDLREADLSKASIAHTDFSGAQLEGCKLPRSLQDCNFSSCDFKARKFVGCDFEGCDFSATMLEGTTFMKCKLTATRGWLDLTRTTLTACQMPGLDLSGIDVSGKDLSSNAMAEVNFSKALLHDTTLPRDLTGVQFIGAQLAGANFQGRNCTSADFSRANLSSANFDGANLSNANFSDCDLSGANLVGAAWPGADVSRANLSGLKGMPHDCTGTRLPGADLRGCDFGGHRFAGAVLDGANLSDCRLDYADFEKASLKLVTLDRSSLACTNFSGANLTGASILTDISEAKWGRYTTVVKGVALQTPIPRRLREVFSPSRMAL